MIADARVGEHMKCNIFALSNSVPVKSFGDIRIRGVVYSNLAFLLPKTRQITGTAKSYPRISPR